MTRKNIFRLALVALLPSVLSTSCRFEDDDYFDESAALRIENFNDQLKQKLVSDNETLSSPQDGWLMQYFPGTSVAVFPGFNIFLKFSANGKVLMAGNHEYLRYGQAGLYTEHTSLYDLLLEDSPVLSFNTWNDVLMPLTDPVDPYYAPGDLVKDGAGMGGDYNLVVTGVSDDVITLRGERHSGPVRLVRATGLWEDYLKAADALRDYITSDNLDEYIVTDGENVRYITGLRERRISIGERAVDPLYYDSLRCVFTPSGFRLDQEATVGDQTFIEVSISEDSTKLVSADGKVTITAAWTKALLPLLRSKASEGMMVFDETTLSAELQTEIANIQRTISSVNRAFQFSGIGFGRTVDGYDFVDGLVLKYYNRSSRSYGFASISMPISVDDDLNMQIAFSGEDAPKNDNMTIFFNRNATMKAAVLALAEALKGNYILNPNNYWHPDGALFKSVDGTRQFRLDYVK